MIAVSVLFPTFPSLGYVPFSSDPLGNLARMVLPVFAVSLVLTLVAERVARRLGVVARPREARWLRPPVPLMGGVEDKTRPPQGATAHRLILRGFAIMGGVEIKN